MSISRHFARRAPRCAPLASSRGVAPARRAALVLVLLAVVACDGVENPPGYGEPVGSLQATFLPGELPTREDGPRVTAVELSSGVFFVGQRNRLFTGRTTDDAYSVGFRLADFGTGWWITPVEGLDPFLEGERTFELPLDIRDAPPGTHPLRVVAVDEAGVAGPERELSLCIAPPFPDNLNSCDPTRRPPAAVISLIWDRDVDLDLRLTGPDGELVDPRRPRLLAADETTIVARHVRDSNGRCVIDGRRREDVVFEDGIFEREEGFWLAYVELYRACGEPSARYSVEVRRRVENEDGTFSLVLESTTGGLFVAAQATGGASNGTYVTAVSL
jgi:hypothetical protein